MSNRASMVACKKSRVSQILNDEDNNFNEDKENHFSKLPDGVIGHILGLLPSIKDAVRTSVLSRDWKCKWTSMRCIKIDDKQISRRVGTNIAFINFVTRILMRTCTGISTFHLYLSRVQPVDYLETWISLVLRHNVENLMIVACKSQRLDSLWCFSGWTSLTILTLCLSCSLVLPVEVVFPNLQILNLFCGSHGRLKIKTEQSPIAGRIILKFPALKHLMLYKCEWVGVNYVEIYAPELIRFQTSCFEEIKNYKFEIFGPKLTTFESMHGSINDFELHTPAITCAILGHSSFVHREQRDITTLLMRTHKILTQFPHLTSLQLSGPIVQALVPSSEYGLVFPMFDSHGLAFPRLKEVKEFHLSSCYLDNTLNILRVLPRLESLTLSALSWADREERGVPWHPEFLTDLKKIKLTEFWGSEVEFSFSKFILENAGNLNEMFISFSKKRLNTPVDVVASRLSKLKPKSSTCQLVVDKQLL